MKRVLITGGAGFVGFSLASKLIEKGNVELTLIDNFDRGRNDEEFESFLKHNSVNFVNADITKLDTFDNLDKDFDYIYHLAAVIGVKNVKENPDRVLYVNAMSTLHLLEFAKDCKHLRRIFFSSTSEIYAGTQTHYGISVPTSEDVNLTLMDITSSRTSYMLSKMYGESILFNYGRKYNIPITIGRYHNVYGPRMGFMHVVPEMFTKIKNSSEIEVASPTHTRAMCYIDDAIEMTILACESSLTESEILNIGNSSEEITIRDLVETIAGILDTKIFIKDIDDTPGSPKRRCPDITKINKLTGYEPKVNLEEGLVKSYSWYESRLDQKYE